MLWLLMACGNKADTGAVSPCALEDRAVVDVLDTTFSGEHLSVTVTALDPAFPAVDDNVWSLMVTDGSSALSDCTQTGEIDMPDHGHGGPIPTFIDQGDGAYEMTTRFTMGGYWEIDLLVVCEQTDEVVLNVCVEG